MGEIIQFKKIRKKDLSIPAGIAKIALDARNLSKKCNALLVAARALKERMRNTE